jgi:hypothetical protein
MRRGRAPWHALGALLVAGILPARAENATPLIISPPGRRVEMRVGERRGFSAVLTEPGTEYAWSLDGTPSGKGNQFEFRPPMAFVGSHEVSVTAVAPSGAFRHTWTVAVEAVGPPTVVRVVPDATVVRVPAGEPLAFEMEAEPAVLTDTVRVRWSLDGAPIGEGPRLVVRAPASGGQRVRAVATSEYGGAAVREWQILASAAAPAAVSPTPTGEIVPDPELAEIVRRAVPEAPKPAASKKDTTKHPTGRNDTKDTSRKTGRSAKPPRLEVARATAPLPSPPAVPEPPPPTPAPPAGVTEDDVRALMFRYEQAWRTRNAAELRRIGHVQTDAQQQALARYFETTRDLEVAVHVLELRAEGGRGVVRFTRRDHFLDPAGREVSKESPPIEKTIVRTPEGVRFAPRS